MTVQVQTPVQYFNGPISIGTELNIQEFTFVENSHVSVKIRGVDANWVYGTDYTVAGAGTLNRKVTLNKAVASGQVLAIFLDVPITQSISPEEGGNLPAATVEYTLDKLTYICQDLDQRLRRAIKASIDDTFDGTFYNVADNTGKFFIVNSDGSGITYSAYTATDLEYIANRLYASIDNVDIVADNIDNVITTSENIVDVNTVGTNIADVSTVAGIASKVVIVADDKANIDIVADNTTNVTAVGTNIANVNAVAANEANINAVNDNKANINAVNANKTNIDTVATNIANVNAVGTNIANVNAVNANKTNIDTVATNITDVNSVSDNITNVNAVADNETNINAVNTNKTNINTVAANISDVNSVGDNITNVNAVADNETNINAVNANKANIDIVSANMSDINAVKNNIAKIASVSDNIANVIAVDNNKTNIDVIANDISSVRAVGQDITKVTSVANNLTAINAVNANKTNIDTVSSNISDVSNVATNSTNITKVADNEININTVANNGTNISTVATNISDIVAVANDLDNIDNASTYATNANIWAEGTDEQVQALGGIHSAKEWAKLQGLSFKGEYSATSTYNKNYYVSKVESTITAFYLSITDNNIGNPLTDTTNWLPLWTITSGGSVAFANVTGSPYSNPSLETALNSKYGVDNPSNYQTDTQVSSSITGHNTSSTAHNDIRQDVSNNTTAISLINGKIPSQATATNQLADKDFVNSTVTSLAAFYVTSDTGGNPFATKAALLAGPYYNQGQTYIPTRNDYSLVAADEAHSDKSARYLYDGTNWVYQYTLNDTPFTAAQLAALNSGATTTNIELIGTLRTSKQDIISDLSDIRNGASAGATAVQPATLNNYATTTALTNGLAIKYDASNPSGYQNATQVSNAIASYHDNTKQDTLVSGTNIKTINNNSLLGSGDISISGGVWGQITGTLSNQTDLSNALNNKVNTSSLSQVYPVIETYVNGTSGYIIWANGYCEQWGYNAVSAKTGNITLLKAYINTDYNVSTSQGTPATQQTNSNYATCVSGYAIDSLYYNAYGTGGGYRFYWRTSGYIPVDWAEANLGGVTSSWRSVTYGNSKFVAVALNKAMYSADGINWTASVLPSGSWYSITYGNGKFVAVASGSDIAAYSTDGITWTASTLPLSTDWVSVTYGNGKFVAVVDYAANIAAYSTDGINWVEAILPVSANWKSVTYGNGKFIAVSSSRSGSTGSDLGIAAYSTDGINWTETTLPSYDQWISVTYGNDKFVAVVNNTAKAAYSTDGITWTASTLPSDEEWKSVTYGNGKFVVVGYHSNIVAYSTDGITWATSTLPSSEYWQSVTYGNGKFVIVANNKNKTAYSLNVPTYYTVKED